jgi:aminopeptidase YwaD
VIRVIACLLVTAVTAACATRATPVAGADPLPAAASATSAPSASRAGTPSSDGADPGSFVRRIEAHLRFLASDALHGRGSGTRDEWIAATYLGARLHEYGFEPMGDAGWFVQQVEVQRYEAAAPTLTIGERTLTHGRELLVRSVTTPRASGRLVTYAPGATLDPGSVVVLPDGTPPSQAAAAVAGAAIVLQRETPQARERWEAAANRPVPVAPHIVGVPPTEAGPVWITLDTASHDAVLAAAPGTVVSFSAELTPTTRMRTWNAVGRLTGADPAGASEVVVLSAHLDHVGRREPPPDQPGADTIYNGADDDASGVVAVLEIARSFAAAPRPRRTVVVAFFGSEEAGGLGSRYFVTRPVVPLGDIVANLQFEMIGRPDPLVPPGTLWLTGFERSTLGAALAAHGARLVADPRPEQRFFERSDNIQFARRGVVAHTVSSFGLHREYHEPSDEIEHINLAHMADAIASLVGPVRRLVDGTDKPAWHEGMRP